MLGVLSLIADSDADSRKGRMAVNMDGTCMQGLSLSSYQSSTLIHSDMLWHSFSCSCRVLWVCNVKSWKKTRDLNATTRLEAQSRGLINCVMHALKLLSIASAVLGLLPSLVTRWFARPHSLLFSRLHTLSRKKCFKHSFGRPIWCAAENWFAVIQFYSMQQSLDSLLNLKNK